VLLADDGLGLHLHSRAKSTCGRDVHIMDNEHLGEGGHSDGEHFSTAATISPRHIIFCNFCVIFGVKNMLHAQFLMEEVYRNTFQ